MKVLQLVNTPRSFFDTQVQTLESRGVECTTVTVPGTASTAQSRSVREYLQYYPEVLAESLDDYDLVHAHYGLMGPFALAQPTRPVVLTLWGSDLMDEESFVHELSRFSARFSDAVILPSTSMCTYLDTDHEVLPWGIDTDLFRPIDRERAREHLGWPSDETVVLFPYPPGREIKNVELARAVVDDIAHDATLRTMSGVDYENVPYHMNAADAVLVTSRRESGPMVVKEATACNVPVVSTDVGFVEDVLDGVQNSYCCGDEQALREALQRVLTSDSRADGRETIMGLEEMGDELLSIYEGVLDEDSDSAAG